MAKKTTLSDLQYYAGLHNGRCLSKEFISPETPVEWACQKGHRFSLFFFLIKQGAWCEACAKEQRRKAIVFNTWKKKAEKLGYKVISDQFEKPGNRLLAECKNKHKRLIHKDSVRNNQQCIICYTENKLKQSFEKLKKVVEKKEGRIISKKYLYGGNKMEFKCRLGHRWEASAGNIKRGHWCPVCGVVNKLSVKDMQYLAAKQGGEFLSKEYSGITIKYKWKCKNGHTWSTTPANIKEGFWCRSCYLDQLKTKGEIRLIDLRKLAISKGGKLLTLKYAGSTKKLKWKCAEGHVWQALRQNVEKGNWCNKCKIENSKLKIEDIQNLARKRGGTLLSKKYSDNLEKLKWKCAKGHMWFRSFNLIKRDNSWCPVCRKEEYNSTTDAMRKIATEKGGNLLSKKYINNLTHLKWQCAKGHVWEATPGNVKAGHWCNLCSNDYKKPTIEQLQKFAASKGGKLLTNDYINNRTLMKWQCAKGHIWMQNTKVVKNVGRWCFKCKKEKVS